MKTRKSILGIIGSGVLAMQAAAQSNYTAQPIPANQVPPIAPGGPSLTATWRTVDSGARVLSGGTLSILSIVGQFDAGEMTGGALSLTGGFLGSNGATTTCYADCDESGGSPRLTANDLACFINRFAVGEAYANCDGSTAAPVLNILDYQCFLLKFAAGCP